MTKPNLKFEVEAMESQERVEQLGKIDQLRELGVGAEISLPQLVVVGDQSSGKSSLLEGLTDLPFPVASELCTRFATQIVFRRSRSSHESIQVSIIPATDTNDKDKKILEGFSRAMTEFSSESFAHVLDEAANCMGLPGIDDDIEQIEKRFSNDVLKIDISGPQQHHLSFVDCPGLFHNPTKYQTTEDSKIIRKLIEDYVQDRRTIIMAVMDGRNNLANQEVFRIAKAADKEGIRTVGIMTKCDALQKGDEPIAIKIAQNQIEKLTHGWFCVRNRTTQEVKSGVSIEQRHELEKVFFKTAPWNVLDKKRVGIASLKASLGKMLSDHVANEFPEICKEIDTRYTQARDELDELGAPRQTTHEQLQHLIKLAGNYQRSVEDSLNGRYCEDGLHPSKIRMHIQDAHDTFNRAMHEKGQTMHFRSTEESFDDQMTGEGKDDSSASDANIYNEIKILYRTSRGRELPGQSNPAVQEALFRHQTQYWEKIAEQHIAKVIQIINDGNDALFDRSCPDEAIRKKIRNRIDPEISDSLSNAWEELYGILRDERSGPLQTTNHYFADNLAKAGNERFIAALNKLGFRDGIAAPINFAAMTSLVHLSNEASAIHHIHDTVKAYYEVALKRFIDNVNVQCVERNLLGPDGPVNVFNPEYVGDLSAGDVAAIAAEDFATSNTREELKQQIDRLDTARKIISGRGASHFAKKRRHA